MYGIAIPLLVLRLYSIKLRRKQLAAAFGGLAAPCRRSLSALGGFMTRAFRCCLLDRRAALLAPCRFRLQAVGGSVLV